MNIKKVLSLLGYLIYLIIWAALSIFFFPIPNDIWLSGFLGIILGVISIPFVLAVIYVAILMSIGVVNFWRWLHDRNDYL